MRLRNRETLPFKAIQGQVGQTLHEAICIDLNILDVEGRRLIANSRWNGTFLKEFMQPLNAKVRFSFLLLKGEQMFQVQTKWPWEEPAWCCGVWVEMVWKCGGVTSLLAPFASAGFLWKSSGLLSSRTKFLECNNRNFPLKQFCLLKGLMICQTYHLKLSIACKQSKAFHFFPHGNLPEALY